jgi:5-methyltetrahydropteroyltriglutamate--homocysteine methyltransferase
MSAVAPGSASRIANTYYKTEEELLYACADAMREEYRAIVEAGLILQLDDPAIAENWDMINPAPTVQELPGFLDGARRGAEPCNPWTAARSHPVSPLLGQLARPAHHRHPDAGHRRRHAGDQRRCLLLRGRQCAVHEHEWRVWQEVKLPDDRLMLPGVVSHATNVVEHPELVAERILRFAKLAGESG